MKPFNLRRSNKKGHLAVGAMVTEVSLVEDYFNPHCVHSCKIQHVKSANQEIRSLDMEQWLVRLVWLTVSTE